MSLTIPHISYLDCIQQERHLTLSIILHFDLELKDLGLWFWCVVLR